MDRHRSRRRLPSLLRQRVPQSVLAWPKTTTATLWVSNEREQRTRIPLARRGPREGPAPRAGATLPPPAFGFTTLHRPATRSRRFPTWGQNPAPTGARTSFREGRDAGYPVVAQAGASNRAPLPVGKDVLLLDPVTGSHQILVDDMNLPTDVQRDPLRPLLISDYPTDRSGCSPLREPRWEPCLGGRGRCARRREVGRVSRPLVERLLRARRLRSTKCTKARSAISQATRHARARPRVRPSSA